MNYEKCVHEFLNDMWNAKIGDVESLHSNLFTPKLIGYSPLGKRVGTQAMQDTNLHWSKAFPDMQLSNINIITSGNMVTAEWRSVGRQQNEFNGLQSTGRKVDYLGVTSFYFADKKVVRYQCSIDLVNMYEQLGFFLERERYPNQNIMRQNYLLLLDQLQRPLPYCSPLSSREVECISLFLNGLSAKIIAFNLQCSYRTVQNHINNAMEKLDCHSKSQLYELFDSLGLLYISRDFSEIITN